MSIKQIMPAEPGWVVHNPVKEQRPGPFPVIAWALVHRDDETDVVEPVVMLTGPNDGHTYVLDTHRKWMVEEGLWSDPFMVTRVGERVVRSEMPWEREKGQPKVRLLVIMRDTRSEHARETAATRQGPRSAAPESP